VPDVAERIEPIKRRTPRPVPSQRVRPATAPRGASMRPQARSEPAVAQREHARREPARREPPRRELPASAPASSSGNPFGGGFWRNVLKLGRKDERSQ
jgi:hypothetical protein